MNHFSLSSLRVRLLLLVLLAVLPALGLILYTDWEQRRHAARDAQEAALGLVRLASRNQDELIQEARDLLVTLAQVPAVQHRDADRCSSLLADVLKRYPRYANLGALDPNGDVFCSAVPFKRPLNIGDRPGVRRSIQTREFTVGAYQIGLIVHRPILPVTYPARDARGRVSVVMFATLHLAWLNQFAAQAKLPPDSTLTLIDRNSVILVRHPNPERWVGKPAPQTSFVGTILGKQADGTAEAAGVDGVPRGYAFTPLRSATGGADAYLSIGIPTVVAFAEADRILKRPPLHPLGAPSEVVAFAEADRILKRNLAGLGIVTVLTLAAAWVGGDLFILRRVKALVNATRRLAAGDLTARSGLPYENGELGQLARAFDEMAEVLEQHTAERKQAEEALRWYAERLRLLHESDRAILAAQSPEAIAQAALGHIRELVPCVRESVVTFDEETREATVLAVHVNGETSLGTGAPVPLEVFGDLGELRQGKVHMVEDIQAFSQPSRAIQALWADRVRAYLNVPLVARGELIGSLNLGSDSPGAFAPEHIAIAQEVADSLAVGIHQARLFRSVSEHRAQLRALAARLAEVDEDERRRLARELHDQIGQSLTVLGLNLNILRGSFSAELAAKVVPGWTTP